MSRADSKRAVRAAMTKLKKKWGDDAFIDPSERRAIPAISTGSPKVDAAIGIGGIPEGRVIEIYGPEACGKTTLTTLIAANAQKKHPEAYVAVIDVEHAFNPPYAEELGLNLSDEQFIFTQPSSGEEAIDTLLSLVESGACSVVILDSVGGLKTKRELEGDVDKETMTEVARLIGRNLQGKIVPACKKTGTSVIFINQERASMNMYGKATTTMGGKSIPYAASVRIEMRMKDIIFDPNDKDEPIGQNIAVKIAKCKVGNPFKKCEIALKFGQGFDIQAELVEQCIKAGIIVQGGAWFTYGTERWQGKAKVAAYFKENPAEYDKLLEKFYTEDDLGFDTMDVAEIERAEEIQEEKAG